MTEAHGAATSYTDAMTELETILSALETDGLDVDQLADRVARAAELIELCRGKIERARTEVERVVVDLSDTSTAE